MLFFKKPIMIVAVALLMAGIYACEKEGPAERAGKNIDNALEGAKKTLDDAAK